MRSTFRLFAFLIVPLVLAAGLLGCEEDVIGVTGEDHPFTLFGILNPIADTQKVRVFPINGKLEQGSAAPIDAVVTSTDLQTGDVRTWQDSILSFPDGSHGYLYWAPFRPEGGHTYRIDVTRSDGERSSAQATVPNPLRFQSAIFAGQVTIPLTFGTSATRLRSFDIEYRVRFGCVAGYRDTLRYSYMRDSYPTGEGLRIDLPFSELHAEMVDSLMWQSHYFAGYGIYLQHAIIRMMVTDAGWNPPDGVYDPEVLIEPGTFSNVGNGFGFLGSGYYVEKELEPSDEALQAAGFRLREFPLDPRDCPSDRIPSTAGKP
ncbi:MAG TPA: hypothetical protein VFG50_13700 [Rhodothermales bacterium]|nr:hypothetical protein [Rhodothermales bacterium]